MLCETSMEICGEKLHSNYCYERATDRGWKKRCKMEEIKAATEYH